MAEYWTEAEKNFVRDNAARLKDREVLVLINKMRVALGRPATTMYGLRRIRQNLGIEKAHGHGVSKVVKYHGIFPAKPSLPLTVSGKEPGES